MDFINKLIWLVHNGRKNILTIRLLSFYQKSKMILPILLSLSELDIKT